MNEKKQNPNTPETENLIEDDGFIELTEELEEMDSELEGPREAASPSVKLAEEDAEGVLELQDLPEEIGASPGASDREEAAFLEEEDAFPEAEDDFDEAEMDEDANEAFADGPAEELTFHFPDEVDDFGGGEAGPAGLASEEVPFYPLEMLEEDSSPAAMIGRGDGEGFDPLGDRLQPGNNGEIFCDLEDLEGSVAPDETMLVEPDDAGPAYAQAPVDGVREGAGENLMDMADLELDTEGVPGEDFGDLEADAGRDADLDAMEFAPGSEDLSEVMELNLAEGPADGESPLFELPEIEDDAATDISAELDLQVPGDPDMDAGAAVSVEEDMDFEDVLHEIQDIEKDLSRRDLADGEADSQEDEAVAQFSSFSAGSAEPAAGLSDEKLARMIESAVQKVLTEKIERLFYEVTEKVLTNEISRIRELFLEEGE